MCQNIFCERTSQVTYLIVIVDTQLCHIFLYSGNKNQRKDNDFEPGVKMTWHCWSLLQIVNNNSHVSQSVAAMQKVAFLPTLK